MAFNTKIRYFYYLKGYLRFNYIVIYIMKILVSPNERLSSSLNKQFFEISLKAQKWKPNSNKINLSLYSKKK